MDGGAILFAAAHFSHIIMQLQGHLFIQMQMDMGQV